MARQIIFKKMINEKPIEITEAVINYIGKIIKKDEDIVFGKVEGKGRPLYLAVPTPEALKENRMQRKILVFKQLWGTRKGRSAQYCLYKFDLDKMKEIKSKKRSLLEVIVEKCEYVTKKELPITFTSYKITKVELDFLKNIINRAV